MIQELIKLTYSLCEIPSVTSKEQEIASFVENYFTQRNFWVKKILVNKDRFCLFIAQEKLSSYRTILCTHMDTVPPHIPPVIDEKKQIIKGRGTCDAKGIAAAMMLALLREPEKSGLLLTVGEETCSDGAKQSSKKLGITCDFLVVGEPTQLKFASYQMGNLAFTLNTTGIKAHSALPHLGDSATHKLIYCCQKILGYPWPQTSLGENLINIAPISGGIQNNIVADEAQAHFLIRTNSSSQSILKTIKQIIGNMGTIEISSIADPFPYFCPQNVSTFIATFGSDAPYLQNLSKNILLVGPGSLSVAHTKNESISFSALEKGFLCYQQLLLGTYY